MIIEANTPEGQKAKIYLKDGTLCQLPIKSYNTETQTATHYVYNEDGNILFYDWKQDGKKMTRQPVLQATVLEGSYAEIDGKRV